MSTQHIPVPELALAAAVIALKRYHVPQAAIKRALQEALAVMPDSSSHHRDPSEEVAGTTAHHNRGHHNPPPAPPPPDTPPPPPPPPPVQPPDLTPASVTLSPTTLSLAEGQASQLTATVKNAAGDVLDVAPDGYTPSSAIVSVTTGGLVTAVSSGSASIFARLGAIVSNTVSISVTGAAGGGGSNFLKHDFEDGTLGPFALAGIQGTVTVKNDPTPRASGKVCAFHLENFPEGGNFDCNQAISPANPAHMFVRGLGQEVWFRGKFFCDTDGALPAIRKFTYWGWSNDSWGFQHGFHLVIASANSVGAPIPPGTPIQFLVSAGYVTASGVNQGAFGAAGNAGPATWYGPGISLKAWHTLKVQLKLDSHFGAGDGILRIWFDDVLIFESTTMAFTSADWTEDPSTYQWVDWRVGQQLNGSAKLVEDRYWDDVSFADSEAAL